MKKENNWQILPGLGEKKQNSWHNMAKMAFSWGLVNYNALYSKQNNGNPY